MNRAMVLGLAAATVGLLTGAARGQAPSEETIAYFQQNCASCHTIGGGRLAGPDLKNVLERREREWLVKFTLDAKAVIDSGDPYAQELLKAARGVVMPKIPTLTRERAEKVLALIEAESQLERSQFAGTAVSDRPLTAADVELGARLFRGTQPFTRGAPACIACHSTREIGGLGGGLLGPDLTTAWSRLEGRKALAAWLTAPPSLTMAPVYRNQPLSEDEILAVVAYLKSVAETGEEAAEPLTFAFVLSGCGGAGLLIFLFDLAWRRRFRDVRRSLVAEARP
jgi:mono/diheme cytochrome c family protein